jgi:hypothetical protein
MINEGFKTTATKEDITRVEVRLDRIEHLLLAEQKREIEDSVQLNKRTKTQYLRQLRKAESGLNGMNTAYAGNLVENHGE